MGTRSETLDLLVWNVILNSPLFEDMEQRLQANTQTVFYVETSEAHRLAIFRNNDRPDPACSGMAQNPQQPTRNHLCNNSLHPHSVL